MKTAFEISTYLRTIKLNKFVVYIVCHIDLERFIL